MHFLVMLISCLAGGMVWAAAIEPEPICLALVLKQLSKPWPADFCAHARHSASALLGKQRIVVCFRNSIFIWQWPLDVPPGLLYSPGGQDAQQPLPCVGIL